MLLRSLLASGAVAVSAILILAVAVIHETPEQVDETASIEPHLIADEALPDPDAHGVIVLSLDGQLFGYTLDGEAVTSALPPPWQDGLSPDGAWQAMQFCPDAETCKLVITTAGVGPGVEDMEANAVELDANFVEGEWARSGSTFAALDESGRLYLVEAATLEAHVVQACCVTAYAWTADDDLLIADTGRFETQRVARIGRDGSPADRADVAAPVTRFYESPDATRFAFAQADNDNLRITTVDTQDWRLTDYGVLHDLTGDEGPQFAIAWSRDGSYLAVGPVSTPYSLYVLDTDDGVLAQRYDFAEGYAGELVWSPAANDLAISTYSPDRLQHEVYVVNPRDSEAPRHILSGCRIVWSPDGRFVAAKAEPHTRGAMAVNVGTGQSWQLATRPGMTPVSWGMDQADAIALMQLPGRAAALLGK